MKLIDYVTKKILTSKPKTLQQLWNIFQEHLHTYRYGIFLYFSFASKPCRVSNVKVVSNQKKYFDISRKSEYNKIQVFTYHNNVKFTIILQSAPFLMLCFQIKFLHTSFNQIPRLQHIYITTQQGIQLKIYTQTIFSIDTNLSKL